MALDGTDQLYVEDASGNQYYTTVADLASFGGGGGELPDIPDEGWLATHPGVPGYGLTVEDAGYYHDIFNRTDFEYNIAVQNDVIMRQSPVWASPSINNNRTTDIARWRCNSKTDSSKGTNLTKIRIVTPFKSFEGKYLRIWIGVHQSGPPPDFKTATFRCFSGLDRADGTRVRHNVDVDLNHQIGNIDVIVYNEWKFGPLGVGNLIDIQPTASTDENRTYYIARYEITNT